MQERDIQGEIEQELTKIEEQEQVRILLAVESGSRAWGFCHAGKRICRAHYKYAQAGGISVHIYT